MTPGHRSATSHFVPSPPGPSTHPRTYFPRRSVPPPASCKPTCSCFRPLLAGSWGHFGQRPLFCLLGPGIPSACRAALSFQLLRTLAGRGREGVAIRPRCFFPASPLREPEPFPWAIETHPRSQRVPDSRGALGRNPRDAATHVGPAAGVGQPGCHCWLEKRESYSPFHPPPGSAEGGWWLLLLCSLESRRAQRQLCPRAPSTPLEGWDRPTHGDPHPLGSCPGLHPAPPGPWLSWRCLRSGGSRLRRRGWSGEQVSCIYQAPAMGLGLTGGALWP